MRIITLNTRSYQIVYKKKISYKIGILEGTTHQLAINLNYIILNHLGMTLMILEKSHMTKLCTNLTQLKKKINLGHLILENIVIILIKDQLLKNIRSKVKEVKAKYLVFRMYQLEQMPQEVLMLVLKQELDLTYLRQMMRKSCLLNSI